MCGICGWIDWDGSATTGVVERMAARLVHRGPDGEGFWRDPDGIAALGHRRLRILDVSDRAHQPMVDPSGSVLTYNGEVYNFPSIRARLEAEGRPVESTGDTEVVLAALSRWGEDALEHFNGMFALALWDSQKRRLLLARDRLGIKPLFWARTARGIAFASEMPSLLAHSEVPRDIRREDLARWLQLGYTTGEQTLARGVQRLLPGHVLEAQDGSVRVRPWYDLTQRLNQRLVTHQAEQLESELETTLRDAVRLRLVSDVPLGCFLSGGVDSSVVAAAAAAEGVVPETLTMAFEGGEDETPAAQKTADALGLPHRIGKCTAGVATEILARWSTLGSDPIADPSLVPTWLISKHARQRWTVALSGDGGDELLGGYPRLKTMPMLERILALPRPIRRGLLPVAPASRWATKLRAALATSDAWQAYQCLQGVWPANDVAGLLGMRAVPSPWPDSVIASARNLPAGTRYRFLDAITFLPDRVLAKVDRASMACSLEVRVPLLDHRLVERLLVLPAHLARGKRPLRKVLSALHAPDPPAAKRGFEVPLAEWLRGPLKDAVEAKIMGRGAQDLGLRKTDIDRAWRRHQRGGEGLAERLLAAAILVGWVEEWMS
ncbi:MAG: asparagine synthase (glutamine-hydrolyzing) [bacterium]|nr:asparagine synthase (glutamine-hydrolyzing) [bacterium]